MLRHLRPAVLMLVWLSLLTGVVYPALVTAVAAVAFPHRAAGSLIRAGGRVVGSELVGQPFSGARYFWSRPSVTASHPYDAAASGGSNLATSNPALAAAVAARIAALRAVDPGNCAPVPVDLVTASASGLDPDISPAAAAYQVDRVARARGLAPEVVRLAVAAHTRPRQLGLLGEPRVDVLGLNLALDGLR